MSVVAFYVVDTQTGEIVSAGATSQHLLSYFETGDREARLGEADPMTQYVDLNTGGLLPKATLSPTVTKDGNSATISPVPRPCQVAVDGDDWVTDSDGSVTINFGGAGTYDVRIRAVSIHEWRQDVTVP